MDLTKNKIHAILISILLCVPLLFRGLYFTGDFFAFGIIALLWCGAVLFTNKSNIKFSSVSDYILLAFTASYLMSSAVAASTYLALVEAFKYLMLLLIYIVIKNFIITEKSKVHFLEILMYVITLSSVISLLTAAGIINFPGAYSAAEIEKWLNGTVQYHNAFGILTIVGFYVMCALNSDEFKSAKFAIYGVCSYFLMFGLIMSYSRGAWVMVPIISVLFLVFGTSVTRLRFFATGISSLAGVMAVLPFFSAFVIEKNTGSALALLVLGLLLSVALYYGVHILLKKLSALKNFKKVSIAIIAVVLVIAVLIVLLPDLFPFLPDQIAERLKGISFEGGTVKERMVFYKDAFNLYKDSNFLLGSGGGAWQYLYGMYQSYLYFTSQAHSYIMQVLVETGALGFVLWIAVIVLFFVQAFRARKSANKNILCAVVCSGAALIIHSFIDFDLSLPAILIVLWCILALLDTLSPEITKENQVKKAILAAVCVVLAVLSCLFYVGFTSYNEGVEIKDTNPNDTVKIAEKFKTASTAMPICAEYKIAYLVYSEDGSATPEKIDALVSREPYSIRVREYAYTYYDKINEPTVCMEHVKAVIDLHPLNPENYYTYCTLINPVVKACMEKGDYEAALKQAKDFAALEERLIKIAEEEPQIKEIVEESLGYAKTIVQMLEGM